MPFFRAAKTWWRAVLGGWQRNGILTLQSGLPFSVAAGTDRSLVAVGADRADVNGVAHTFNSADRAAKIQKFFDTSVFSLPALGTFGTSSCNFLFGPGIENFDAGLFKRFALTERKQFELRWEVFNSLNRPNFLNPVNAVTNPPFGRLTSARDPRIMQVALKFYYWRSVGVINEVERNTVELLIEKMIGQFERGAVTRRRLALSITALFAARPSSAAPDMKAVTLNHVTLKVADVQRTSKFYQEVFGMPLKQHSDKTHILGVGPSNPRDRTEAGR